MTVSVRRILIDVFMCFVSFAGSCVFLAKSHVCPTFTGQRWGPHCSDDLYRSTHRGCGIRRKAAQHAEVHLVVAWIARSGPETDNLGKPATDCDLCRNETTFDLTLPATRCEAGVLTANRRSKRSPHADSD